MRTVFTLLSVASAATISHASIVSTSGAASVIAPPESVRPNNTTSDETLFVFREGSSITLGTAFPLDQTAGGLTDGGGDLVPGQVDAGDAFNAYYLHADTASSAQDYIGSITFGQPIIGVVHTSSTLATSDILVGVSGTEYPTGASLRDIEFGTNDQYTISADRLTFSFDLSVGSNVDSIRVITEIPAPPSVFGIAIASAAFARRRQSELRSS